MGSKLIHIDEIRFLPYESTNEENTDIVFSDLVRTLKIDQTKYARPELNCFNEVLVNEIYVHAAKKADMREMIVEGPWANQYFNLTPAEDEVQDMINNFIFFEEKPKENIRKSPEVRNAFKDYVQNCRKIIEHGGIMSRGKIKDYMFGFPEADIMSYSLKGKLVSPESKQMLTEPTRQLYRNLEDVIGNIRSINGIKYNYRKQE